jgi:DNA-binding transcriptional regulator YiaG
MRDDRDLHAAEEALEDAADVAIYDERKADLKTENPLPADVTMEILRGSSRLKALRNWRRLTQAELATTIGVSHRRRPGRCWRRHWIFRGNGLNPRACPNA